MKRGIQLLIALLVKWVNERRNRIIHSSARINQRVDKYTQKDNILWYKTRQGKAESTDLEARYQEPINSTANDSKHNKNYSKSNHTTNDTLSR